MGGQQFLTSGLLIDTTEMKNILDFDYERGLIKVEGGILWTDLIFYLQKEQQGKLISGRLHKNKLVEIV